MTSPKPKRTPMRDNPDFKANCWYLPKPDHFRFKKACLDLALDGCDLTQSEIVTKVIQRFLSDPHNPEWGL